MAAFEIACTFIQMNIFLDDSECRQQLFPFSATRHVADLRVGILTIREKWEKLTGKKVITNPDGLVGDELHIAANIIPTLANVQIVMDGANRQNSIPAREDIRILNYPWNIFQYNDWALRQDYELMTDGRLSAKISESNTLINPSNIFVEEGASIECSVLNANDGPIYIGGDASILEGCLIRGPFAIGEGSTLKMGAKIYGATTVGPFCTAGGEIKNSIFFGYSNKAHDGYLGDSVIGEWCNLGAGTSNSNVKNTAGDVKYYTGDNAEPLSAGNKAGLLMADYSRAAINTSFNTGTIVGVSCNIFGAGQPPKFVPHFSWGPGKYRLDKALQDIDNWKQMKKQRLTQQEIDLLTQLYSS